MGKKKEVNQMYPYYKELEYPNNYQITLTKLNFLRDQQDFFESVNNCLGLFYKYKDTLRELQNID